MLLVSSKRWYLSRFWIFGILLIFFFLSAPKNCNADSGSVVKVEFVVGLRSEEGKEVKFVVEVHPEWAPLGAARFLELVDLGDDYWEGIRFFRAIDGFLNTVQINPLLSREWKDKFIEDDPVVASNKRGYLTFSGSAERLDSRTAQFFINLDDNSKYDRLGFAPFAKVVDGGMVMVDQIYGSINEGSPVKSVRRLADANGYIAGGGEL
jgi:cyclophilin family peptidyl-prolyl cis-trans isomerase